MNSGARQGKFSGLQRFFAKAMAKKLQVFVIPGQDIARAHGLNLEAAGLQIVASPRHASVLLIVGDLPPVICEAASIVYAQMMRPKVLCTVGVANQDGLSPLPTADVSVGLSQQDLISGVAELRTVFEKSAFQLNIKDYDAPALHIRIEYVCPMHPEVIRDEPGSCPKCGMFLVPREVQANTVQASSNEKTGHPTEAVSNLSLVATEKPAHSSLDKSAMEYFCPMHPEIVQNEPGSCPKCGMFLEPREKLSSSTHGDQSMQHNTATEYFCPMHPEVVQNEPGSCPKCGMFLEPRDKQSSSTHQHEHEQHLQEDNTATEYFCPMHPEVVQNEPGSCPKCGMFLEPRDKQSSSTHQHEHEQHLQEDNTATEYFCPMHPEVVQNEPGSCPKCGMFLEPRDKQNLSTHQHEPIDHSEHAQMNHDESGFMSMIDVTKDLPRSSDDLQMEWIDAPFGPFFPGLPSGLQLTFTLDGDTVAGSTSHAITENIALLESAPMHAGCFVKHFLSLDPLTPVASQLLICKAMENIADIQIETSIAKARIGALERERIASHLSRLVLFAQQTGFAWLARSAGLLQLKVLAADITEIAKLKPALEKLIKHIRNTPLLKPRTSGIARLLASDALCGVVARSIGVNNDVRSSDEIYLSLGFKTINRHEGDAWARLQIRLDEIKQSIELIEAAGAINLAEMIKLDELSGKGQSSIETPRGKATLQLSMDKGFVSSVHLEAPSNHHLSLLDALTDQQELGDALIAVGSLDLSPWEIHQ